MSTPQLVNPSTNKTSIGLFGGSFNPIHLGHIQLAKHILRLIHLDEIWLMVSPQNPLKQSSTLLDDQLRLKMAQKALQDEPKIKACDYEFHLSKPSYTWNTLQALSKDKPDTEFTLIIGADNWQVFNHWAHHKDILNNYHIAIYPRVNAYIDINTLPSNVILLNTPLYNVSSTEVRQRISKGLPINNLIPETIIPMAITYYL